MHWYETSTHPFNGVYKLEMVVEKHVNRKRKRKGQNTTCRCNDLLKLDDVDILVYEFNLTKERKSSLQENIDYQEFVATRNKCNMRVC